MDWNSIEHFLKETIWGLILLGALGSALSYFALNLIGRANKGRKLLWAFYKEGRTRIFNRALKSSSYKEQIRFNTLFMAVIGCFSLINSTIVSEDSTMFPDWLNPFISALALTFCAINFSIYLKVNKRYIQDELKESEELNTTKRNK